MKSPKHIRHPGVMQIGIAVAFFIATGLFALGWRASERLQDDMESLLIADAQTLTRSCFNDLEQQLQEATLDWHSLCESKVFSELLSQPSDQLGSIAREQLSAALAQNLPEHLWGSAAHDRRLVFASATAMGSGGEVLATTSSSTGLFLKESSLFPLDPQDLGRAFRAKTIEERQFSRLFLIRQVKSQAAGSVGYLVLEVDSESLAEIMHDQDAHRHLGTQFSLLDENRRLIVTTNPRSARASLAAIPYEASYYLDSDLTVFVESRDLDRDDSLGLLVLAGSSPIEAAIGKVENARQRVFLCVALAALSLVFFCLLFVWTQRYRIRKLSRAAQSIRDGNLRARANISGGDEIAELGAEFDAMALEIEGLAASLAERQRHLEEKTITLHTEIRCREWLEEERRGIESAIQSAQKMEAIGQLAAGIAHEINTPAQYIGDNLAFARDSFQELLDLLPETIKTREDATYLKEEVPVAITQSMEGLQRISEVVSALREFAQPVNHDKHMIDLRTIIRNTVTVSRSAWSDFCEIELQLGHEPIEVLCHSDEIGQCLLNIIVNASEAIQNSGKAGRGIIQISCEQVANEARIIVTDNGCGMPQHVKKNIFNLFFTTKFQGKGRGQGLALAQRSIVKRHGGAIEVSTEVGQGSRFTIQLPKNSPVESVKGGENHETRPVGR